MSSYQKVVIHGNVGSVDLKYTPSGRAVCNLSVATSETWKDKEGATQTRTEWHRVVIWGKDAENAGKFLVKGQEVTLDGRLQTRHYEKDGVKHYMTEIMAGDIRYGRKPNAKKDEDVATSDLPAGDSDGSPAETDIPY